MCGVREGKTHSVKRQQTANEGVFPCSVGVCDDPPVTKARLSVQH